jgi:GDP-L-fucose synthase
MAWILSKANLQFDTARADGQFRKPASNKKLLSLISQGESGEESFKFTPFEEALEHTVGWFLQNYDTARIGSVQH